MLAVGDNDRAAHRIISKELLLPIGYKPGQGTAGGRRQAGCVGPLHGLVTAAQSKSKALQRINGSCLERLEKHTAFEGLVVLKIEVAGTPAIAQSIKNAGGVTGHSAQNVPLQHDADIAIWKKIRHQRTFVEQY